MIGGSRARTLIGISFAVLLLAASRTAGAQVVTTFAGSGEADRADGVGPAASFVGPVYLAVDAAGNVYVVEHGFSGAVRKITTSGVVSTLGGTFRWPWGVATDLGGSVYVTTESGWSVYGGSDAAVRKIAPDGRVTTVATLGGSVMSIAGLAIDSLGNLVVADAGDTVGSGMGKILKVGPGGTVTALTGPGTPFRVENPWYVAVDSAGNLYVTDWGSVIKLGAGGSTTVLASGLKNPSGIALVPSGGLYVSETGRNRILKIAPHGAVSVVAGSETEGSTDGPGNVATFSRPEGLALDGAGNLYVADSGNNKIRKIAFAADSACAVTCTDWTVPSVARTPGSRGSFWTSDLTIHNRGPFPADVTLAFLDHDTDGSSGPERDATIGPFGTVTFPDVLSSAFGLAEGWGALKVRTTGTAIVVRSRTSTIGAGGTLGDGLPGVRGDRFITDQTSPLPLLTGLREDARFRTNLILVNGTAAPVEVLVTAIDSSGAVLGTKTRTLGPFEMTQDSRFLVGPEFGAEGRSDVTVALSTVTPGGAFTACAFVIDNASNDPTTVVPQ